MENKKVILTGDRPTGKLHIGHYVGSLKRRVELQNSNKFDEIYIMIADTQALTDKFGNVQNIKDNILEVALDYLSIGIDPSKSTIFIQSQIPQLFELTSYFLDLVTLSRLERNPTVKGELQLRDFNGTIPVGFLCYPVSQAADITLFEATDVPVGIDQAPMIEQTVELVHKFNSLYGETLVSPNIMLDTNSNCQRLPGTDGKNKMSKSLDNCIYLSDDKSTVSKKVMNMYTDETHLKVEDKGHTENNPVFIYLEAFASKKDFDKYLPQYKCLKEMEQHYRNGGLGDVTCKKFLASVLNDFLDPIRVRRKEYENNIPQVYEILKQGSKKALKKAEMTIQKIRKAIKVDYFDDIKFVQKQVKFYQAQHKKEEAYLAYLEKQNGEKNR